MTEAPHLMAATPSPQAFVMAFALHDNGWASLEVKCGEQVFTINNLGYCTDGLGDLVRAALRIATGAARADVIFDCEPQIWGLAIEPAGLTPNNARLARLTIRDGGTGLNAEGHSDHPVWKWGSNIVLEGHITTDGFATAVQAIASEAREDFDDATYRDRWGYSGSLEGFPLRGLRALETALAIPEYRE